jgi:hypothetical protein
MNPRRVAIGWWIDPILIDRETAAACPTFGKASTVLESSGNPAGKVL